MAQMKDPMTSHQICQIRLNPRNTAKKAVRNPIGLLLGMWIDS